MTAYFLVDPRDRRGAPYYGYTLHRSTTSRRAAASRAWTSPRSSVAASPRRAAERRHGGAWHLLRPAQPRQPGRAQRPPRRGPPQRRRQNPSPRPVVPADGELRRRGGGGVLEPQVRDTVRRDDAGRKRPGCGAPVGDG